MKFKSLKYPNLRVNYKDGESVHFQDGIAEVEKKALQDKLAKRKDVEKVEEKQGDA